MRFVPPRLQEHLSGRVTTTCLLLKIVLQNGHEYGVTTHDQDIDFRGLTYYAENGFTPSIIATDSGLSVDNGECEILAASAFRGITAQMAARGDLDNAVWSLYLVNWADLSQGAILLDAGDIGQVKVTDGMVYTPEIISFAMRLRQNIGQVWSRRCRATFGTPAGTHTGCGVDTENMWHEFEVTAVYPEDDQRIFADSNNIIADMKFPARVMWDDGDNESPTRMYQVEAYSAVSGTVALFEPMPFPIKVGDKGRIRKDCNKSPSDCIAYGNFINYQGEPFIPVGDGLETMTPGAQVFGGLNGSNISG